MIRFLAAATLLLTVPAVAQKAPAPTAPTDIDPARLATARDIVAVVLPPSQRQQIMTSIVRSMQGNMVAGMVNGMADLKQELATKPAVKQAFDRFIARQQQLAEADINGALPELVEAYARAYARNFTADDLTSIKAFVVTPAGTKFLQRAPQLLADPDVAAWQRRLAAQAMARQPVEFATFDKDLRAARGAAGQ